jgi:beta-mannosidase
MLSCHETGEMSERPSCVAERAPIRKSARMSVANETMDAVTGKVAWALRGPSAKIIHSGECDVSVDALSSLWLDELDFSDCDELSHYFSYDLTVGNKIVSTGTALFCMPKHYNFIDPRITVERAGDSLTVSAKAYAKSIELYCDDADFVVSDNFFDLNADSVEVRILRGNPLKVKARSVFDIAFDIANVSQPL